MANVSTLSVVLYLKLERSLLVTAAVQPLTVSRRRGELTTAPCRETEREREMKEACKLTMIESSRQQQAATTTTTVH